MPCVRDVAPSASAPHEGRADDDAVGVRGDLGGLVAGGDAEADADRQVGDRAGAGDQRRRPRRRRWRGRR